MTSATWNTRLNNYVYLQLNVSENTDSADNLSSVNWSLYIICDAGSAYNSWSNSWYVQVNGTTVDSGNSGYTLSSGQSLLLSSGTSGNIYHNADGSLSINVQGYYDEYPTLISQTFTLTDYARPPSSPAFTSVTRTIASEAVVVTTSTSPAGTPTYYVDYSKNGGAYGNALTQQTAGAPSTFTFSGLTQGSTYQFRTYASLYGEGTSAYTYSSSYTIPTIPGAPASISVGAPAGRALTVTAGTATTGGTAILGYYVQASTDGKATWGSPLLMTSQAYNFTGLTGGATYWFRVYATNQMPGTPNYTTSSTGTFVPAGGKRYRGATEANPNTYQSVGTASRWSGTAWQGLSITKKWVVGTGWVNFT